MVDYNIFIELLVSIFLTATIGLLLYQFISKWSRRLKDVSTIEIQIKRDLTTEMIAEYEDRISAIDNVKEKSYFIMMIIEIEKELRQLTSKKHVSEVRLSTRRLIDTLVQDKYLDPKWSSFFRELWYIRNKVIHGEEISKNDLEFGISMAIMFLRSLREIEQ